MKAIIWMDAWQLQCCGDRFQVGSEVTWQVAPTDGSDLTEVLGAELAATVTGREEHHGDAGTQQLTGTVRSIRAVCHDLAPLPGGSPRELYPVPGTAELTDMQAAVCYFRTEKATFAGYLVELA